MFSIRRILSSLVALILLTLLLLVTEREAYSQRRDRSLCRAHVDGPYAVTYSGAEDDGEFAAFIGVLVLDQAGTFRLRGHYTYPGGYRSWIDYQGGPWAWTDNLAIDAGSGCELLVGPFGVLPVLTGIVSPDGRIIVLQTGASAGTAVRQAQ